MRIEFKCYPELKGILPEPVPAKRMTPDWLKGMPMTALDPDIGQELPTVKQCPPFIDAMTSGFMILLPCDVRFSGGKFSWDWPEFPVDDFFVRSFPGSSPLAHHHPTQAVNSPFFREGRLFIKFINFWTIKAPEGVSLLFTHPFNRGDLPFLSLTGMVDCDRYHENFVHFPAAWLDDGFDGVLPKGTPVSQVIPIRRADQDFDLAIEPMTDTEMDRFFEVHDAVRAQERVYRDVFRSKK
ncbi:MAG: hypothetical protein VW268_12460 [Rhodospirillaceae bacterium]